MLKSLIFVLALVVSPFLYATDCEEALRDPVSAMDWIELESLMTAPVTADGMEKLSLALARHVPKSPLVRAVASLEVYAVLNIETPLHLRLNYDQDAEDFARELVRKLVAVHALSKRDGGGNALLIDWINAGVHIEAMGEGSLSLISEGDKKLFLKLLDERSRDPDFDFDVERKQQFMILLADSLPVKLEEKRKLLTEIFGEFASMRLLSTPEYLSSYSIVERLLQLLQTQATSLVYKDEQLQKLFESAY